jgi:hypothetical protein
LYYCLNCCCTAQSLSHPGIPQYIDYFEEDTATDRAFYIVQVSRQQAATPWVVAQELADS